MVRGWLARAGTAQIRTNIRCMVDRFIFLPNRETAKSYMVSDGFRIVKRFEPTQKDTPVPFVFYMKEPGKLLSSFNLCCGPKPGRRYVWPACGRSFGQSISRSDLYPRHVVIPRNVYLHYLFLKPFVKKESRRPATIFKRLVKWILKQARILLVFRRIYAPPNKESERIKK